MKIKHLLLGLNMLLLCCLPLWVRAQQEPVSFPGEKNMWEGYQRYDFKLDNRDAIVVVPNEAAAGRPWIWRPAFFGAFPSVDKDLLAKGFHVAYYDLTHLYGSPRAVRLGTAFYQEMTERYQLSPKVVVEGLSRGGYFAFNWAAANPEKVACLYVDAPVCDIMSWPGKKQAKLWNDFLKEWQVKDAASGAAFPGNALAHLNILAAHHVPIIAVCGDADQTVPYIENLKPYREKYQQLGGTIELILKPGCDHHPHSLENPEAVVDFILRYQEGYTEKQHIRHRGSVTNAFARFQNEKKGCVAFLGGSITEMRGWKEQVEEDLRQRFPETEFQFIEAGIASTGSTPHAFRLEQDVLAKGTPDLLFLEAAVNDATNYFTAEAQVRGMEGIVRHLRKVNPRMDLMFLYFMYDPFIPLLEKDIEPDVIMNHERVANHYYITSINLAREITERMTAGELTWKDFGGVHPSWMGHKYYTAAINRVFDADARLMARKPTIQSYSLPEILDAYSYEKGHFVDIHKADKLKGFQLDENWMPKKHTADVGLRNGFHKVPMLESVEENASLRLEFEGKAIGIFCVSGPAAGVLEYTIDGKAYKPLEMYTEWSSFLYIPWVYMLATELSDGRHVLNIRVKHGQGKGTECQIRNFVVN